MKEEALPLSTPCSQAVPGRGPVPQGRERVAVTWPLLLPPPLPVTYTRQPHRSTHTTKVPGMEPAGGTVSLGSRTCKGRVLPQLGLQSQPTRTW